MPAGRGRSGMGVGRGDRAVVGALVGALAGAVLTVAVAGPAAAKGPESVTITPPGGDPVEVSVELPPDDADSSDGEVGRPVGEEPIEPDPRFARLTEALGIWEVTGVGGAVLPEAPSGDLGPELEAEWTMYNPVPANPDAAPRVVQAVYPLAEGGPLVHTEGGQRFFQNQETTAGWFRAPDDLLAALEDAGVEVEFRTPDAPPAGEEAATPTAGSSSEGRQWARPMAIGTGAVLVAAAGLAATRAWRRRTVRATTSAG